MPGDIFSINENLARKEAEEAEEAFRTMHGKFRAPAPLSTEASRRLSDKALAARERQMHNRRQRNMMKELLSRPPGR